MSALKEEQHESFKFSFSWGQNEDYSPGDSISVLRNCIKEVGGKVRLCDFGEGEVHAIKHIYIYIYILAEGFC